MYQEAVQLLQPTVVTLRVCGVCPSALRGFHIPTSNKIYALFLALLPLSLTPNVVGILYDVYNDITLFVRLIGWTMVVTEHCTFLLSSFMTSRTLVRFFMVFESAQQSLFELNIRQPNNPTAKSQIIWLILLSWVAVPRVAIHLLDFDLDVHYGIQFLTFAAVSIVRFGMVCKMRVLMALVKGKFDLLNWHLDDLNNRWPLFLPRPPDVSFRELSCVAQWRRTRFVQESQDTRTVTAEKISNFNKAHLKLHYACAILNSVITWDAFFLALTTGINVVTNVINLFMSQPHHISSTALGTRSILNVVDDVLGLTVVLTLVTKIKEESKRTALLVHDLLDEDRHSPEVVEELEQFSLALLHRQTSFSAAGFFDIDLKLVSKMASILAPIILFLVQNDNRPRAGRNKSVV